MKVDLIKKIIKNQNLIEHISPTFKEKSIH